MATKGSCLLAGLMLSAGVMTAGGAVAERIFPADVRTVGIVSVSSLIPEQKFVEGTNLLARAGYRLKIMPNVRADKVASARERARLFEAAWLDPEIDLLFFARGGEGAFEVVDQINWERLRGRSLPVIGFSDVTIILNAMEMKGVGHPCLGPMLTTLATYCSAESRQRLRQVLEDTPPSIQLKVVKAAPSEIRGLPIGGHLERFTRLGKKGLRPSTAGRIVFFEGLPKTADRNEAYLGQLVADGAFKGAAAVVFCDFNRDWEPAKVAALFVRFAAKVDCPVFSGYPFGHVPESYALDFKREIALSTDGVLAWQPLPPNPGK